MTVDEFRKAMAETKYIVAGSDLHLAFHAFSQEALKLTAELNGSYHTPAEVHELMSRLTGSEIDESFGLFPPFHTDCGKNTRIGKRVFIKRGERLRLYKVVERRSADHRGSPRPVDSAFPIFVAFRHHRVLSVFGFEGAHLGHPTVTHDAVNRSLHKGVRVEHLFRQ